jgi:hypothetical protein
MFEQFVCELWGIDPVCRFLQPSALPAGAGWWTVKLTGGPMASDSLYAVRRSVDGMEESAIESLCEQLRRLAATLEDAELSYAAHTVFGAGRNLACALQRPVGGDIAQLHSALEQVWVNAKSAAEVIEDHYFPLGVSVNPRLGGPGCRRVSR